MRKFTVAMFLVVGALLTSFGFKVMKSATPATAVPNDFYLYQAGVETLIPPGEQTIQISRAPFAIRFFNKKYDEKNERFYAAMITALLDEKELDLVQVGMPGSQVPFFEPGTGMAPDRSGRYENLIFNENGNHYLMYDGQINRLQLLSESGSCLKLEFSVNALYYQGISEKMEKTRLSRFYLAVWVDHNLNDVIEEGELLKLKVEIR